MALARFQNLPAEQRAAILEKAASVFAEQGYAECSYNDLLRELGMGKSQAYYYFADKADLFLTAVAACYERFYEEARTLALPKSAEAFWDYVRRLTLLGFRYQSQDPVASKLTRALVGSEVRFRVADALMSPEGTSREQHQRWIELGQELGAVRTDLDRELLERLSLEFAQFVDGFFAERAESATPRERERYADVFTDLTKRLFAPAPKALSTKKKGAR
jgi:AcrR family transcriptional regulator